MVRIWHIGRLMGHAMAILDQKRAVLKCALSQPEAVSTSKWSPTWHEAS